MRRTITFPFGVLGLILFLWISLPKNLSDPLRSWAVSIFFRESKVSGKDEITRLEVENQRLKSQLEHVYEWAVFTRQIGEQFDFLKGIGNLSKKRAENLKEILASELSSVPALVIYRDPSSWSSTIWVNVGEENNLALGKNIIAKNSPVIADGALVGVVDYVGEKQARIRLITDSGLSPAVRVARGSSQNQLLIHKINELLSQVKLRTDCSELTGMLNQLKERCDLSHGEEYLAKGEVHGSSAPFWRARSPILKGIGFNYDYPDSEGLSQKSIIKEGDLLVTSGLDGVFPMGLQVGTVSKVAPLKEGGYAYEIEVRPISNRLNELHTVFILPSLSE
jgi:cell shape-determining protein MreC